MTDTTTKTEEDFETFLSSLTQRVLASARERAEKLRVFLASQPQTSPCPKHSEIVRPIDAKRSSETSVSNGTLTAIYAPCHLCAEAERLRLENERLGIAGVPANLLGATLENWEPDEGEADHVAIIKEFTQRKRGFLILLGRVGTGKTHLAVGAMRSFRSPRFYKQSSLLRALRKTYEDHKAEDPIQACQDADLLVLDEVGVSSGG